MSAIVRLDDIVEALEMQMDEYSSFLDCETGQVETVSHDLLHEAEELHEEDESDADDDLDLPEWQKREWEMARLIVSTNRFRKLPSKFDVHEWAIMQDFSNSVESDEIREDLLFAIHGAGAFRHFKHTVRRHDIESAWFAFRTEALRQTALEWCEANQIVWE